MSVRAQDLVFMAGGEALSRYGVLVHRTSPGEDTAETFTRASTGLYVAKGGTARWAAANVPRVSYLDLDGSRTFQTPALRLERATTNLCLYSEDVRNVGGWSAIGTPGYTVGATLWGDVALNLINDDDVGALEGYYQRPAFTGNAKKAISVVVSQGSSASSVFWLADGTSATSPLLGILTWSGGVPVVNAAFGTYLGYTVGKDRTGAVLYVLYFQTTTVTAAHDNQFHIYPATDVNLAVGQTGTLYVGGVQIEDALFPSSYIKTTTVAVTRAADSFIYKFPFFSPPITVLIDAIWHVYPDAGSATNYEGFQISGGGADYFLGRIEGTTSPPTWSTLTQYGNPVGIVSASVNGGPIGYGVRMKSRHVLRANGVVFTGVSIAGAAEVVSDMNQGPAVTPGLSDQYMRVGGNIVGQPGYLDILALKVAFGEQTMADMVNA